MSGASDSAIEADVVVLGGGLAGLSMAVALAGAGVRVACVDRDDPAAAERGDSRTTAVAPASRRLFERLGVWAEVAGEAGPMHEIRVADAAAPLFLHFGADERPAGEDGEPLGWIVDNAVLRRALGHRAAALPTLRHVTSATVAAISAEPSAVRLNLEDGRQVRASLLIGADGRASSARTWAKIPVMRGGYGQSAIVCTIGHANPHNGIALEHFLPSGPFAVLPMTGNRSSIVWSERDDRVRHYLGLDEAAFLDALRQRTGDWLGALTVLSPRAAWPLSAQIATRLTGPRLALVGEAAHAVHPVAGQGFNLSLRDVAALAETVIDARRLGLDPGGPGVLADYERRRRFDTFLMAAVCDGVVRLFSNDVAPLRLARDIGLALVHRLPVVKRGLMRQAMGLAGSPSRLSRGTLR